MREIYIAKIVIEASTPLALGSGNPDVLTDAKIALCYNRLPYIPGTSLAGVFRHNISNNKELENKFGYTNKDDSYGSSFIFTDAYLIGEDGKPNVGLITIPQTEFYHKFNYLPIRHHNKISNKGVTIESAKFDNEVVYKGARFVFELEYNSNKCSNTSFSDFEEVLKVLFKDEIRLGGKSTSGYGKIEVISCKTRMLDLTKELDLQAYINKSSSLRDDDFWKDSLDFKTKKYSNFKSYTLKLQPEDFFYFGARDRESYAETDITQVTEDIIVWNDGLPTFKYKKILIPASSIKGALLHRTAFHYNRIKGYYAEDLISDTDANNAVIELFGSANPNDKRMGKLIFSDIIDNSEKEDISYKIFNHVKIDRFTSAAINGALFSEKVVDGSNITYTLIILMNTKEDISKDILSAFNAALKDLINGMLPLGGAVNKGYGRFTGTLTIN